MIFECKVVPIITNVTERVGPRDTETTLARLLMDFPTLAKNVKCSRRILRAETPNGRTVRKELARDKRIVIPIMPGEIPTISHGHKAAPKTLPSVGSDEAAD